MKVIDLLNKIANDEEVPKHIHIKNIDSYTWKKDVKAYWSDRDENNLLSDLNLSITELNDEVEIIEDIPKKNKKIEYIEPSETMIENHINILKKINEIIDKVNGK